MCWGLTTGILNIEKGRLPLIHDDRFQCYNHNSNLGHWSSYYVINWQCIIMSAVISITENSKWSAYIFGLIQCRQDTQSLGYNIIYLKIYIPKKHQIRIYYNPHHNQAVLKPYSKEECEISYSSKRILKYVH